MESELQEESNSSNIPILSFSQNTELTEFEKRKPAYFKNKNEARAYELGRRLILKKENWSGKKIMTSADCACVLMFDVPEDLEIKTDIKNKYQDILNAMKNIPKFFKEEEIVFGKLGKGSQGMRYIEYKHQ